MPTQIADAVLMRQSDVMESNTVVVEGQDGVLLIDPGIRTEELASLARELRAEHRAVVAGFSTHPHWDHVLWHEGLGDPPRYGTAVGADAMRDLLATPGWTDRVAAVLPPGVGDEIPLELFGLITRLPEGAGSIPWDGPSVRILEHRAHARGHAALLVEQSRVLIAGDLLSDVLVPILDLAAADPIADYLDALRLIDSVVDEVDVVVPGHGSVGVGDEISERIERDRAYVESLRTGGVVDDRRIGPSAKPGWEWVADLHENQVRRLD